MAPADTDTADDMVAFTDGISSPEDRQPRRMRNPVKQRGIVLDELPPLVGGHPEGNGGECLVLRAVQSHLGGPIHAQKRLQVACIVDDGDAGHTTNLTERKSTRLNSSHSCAHRMPSFA